MNTAQITATTLEHVRSKVPVLFDRDSLFYGFVEKRDVEVVSDRDMRGPLEIRTGGNPGHFDPDGGSLGRGDGPSFDKFTIGAIHLKYAFEYTTKAQWATDTDRKSVVRSVKRSLAKSMAEFRRFVDSLAMTGGDGVLGTVGSVANAAGVDTVTLDSDGFGARLLRFGQTVNYYNAALTVNRTAGAEKKITFHDIVNKQVKTPTTAGLIATDKVVAQGLSATPPVSLFGVSYHHSNASTGTWLGMARADNPEIRANRVNAGTAALALSQPRLAINKIGDRVGMDNMRRVVAWMHPCQQQAYEELGQLVSIIQKQARDEGLDLYFSDNMQMAGAPVKTSYSWDKKRIDFVDREVWGRAELHPADFYEGDDGKRLWEVRSTDGGLATSWISYIVASFNLFVENPAACSYIDALTIPSGY